MQQGNGSIGILSPEVQKIILENMTLPDLMSFAKTRIENREGITEYIAKRRAGLFRAYVHDVDALIKVLDRTGSLVSGSSALSLVQAEAEAVVTQDLDFYVTESFEAEVVKHFKENEGYVSKQDVVKKPEYDSSAISKIIKLANGDKKIDIITTHWTCAIAPILQFHSTAVMNYVTAQSIVSLYPRWTAANMSFVNPQMYVCGKTNLRTVDVLMKYIRRGFKISADPFSLGEHDCEENKEKKKNSGYCPHKMRSTVDDEVLKWDFGPKETLGDTSITCQDLRVMAWCLGGFECADGNKEETVSYMLVTA
ncbi:hypothetical protein DEU56DRAFT_750968 [Suillus clintonianus]|uniref:uncharacterized protein n=1 Tax=Suillus clintonianus TaxID=1904413 RepID=UPI001B87EC87|nr:uncharacterized protein DEU56DRAFT_750968 [Suillus clintonianus]KAG2155404.1 hypothetical protein DEU56DRAFT_750968 [Suillus clintonianus]